MAIYYINQDKTLEHKADSKTKRILKKASNVLETIIRKIPSVDGFYRSKKKIEFIDSYFPKFIMFMTKQDNLLYKAGTVAKYNALSDFEKICVELKCAEIYSYNEQLTIDDFYKTIKESKKATKISIG